MTRAEHMRWCKGRALNELTQSGPTDAVASMLSDLSKHDETLGLSSGPLALLGMMEIAHGPESVRRWIEGFAE